MDKPEKDEKKKKKDKKSKKKKKSKKEKKEKDKEKENESELDKTEDEKEKEEYEREKDDIIADNFVVLLEMGRGAFGQIHLTFNKRENIAVATKKEFKQNIGMSPQLKMEFNVLRALLKVNSNPTLTPAEILEFSGQNRIHQSDVIGFPKLYGFGEQVNYYYLILQLLGPNLVDLFNYCKFKFSIPTVCMISIQMLTRIEYIHNNNYLHRDIKPENFLIGSGAESNIIYLIDYGLCRRYRDKSNQHIAYRENRNLTGTARYVSINTHLGIEQSRRDDLESIGYVIIYFMKAYLPWQGIKGVGDKFTKIMEKKLQIPTEVLCKGLPDEISIYLNYCKGLRFEDKPDYEFIKGLFSKLLNYYIETYYLQKNILKYDWTFDEKNYLINIIEKKNPKMGLMLKKEKSKLSSRLNLKKDISANSSTPTDSKIEKIEKEEPKDNDKEDYNIFDDLANNINNNKIQIKNSSSSSENSEKTEKDEMKDEKVDLRLSEDGRSAELEDIDHMINRLKKTNFKKSVKKDISEETIEMKPNADKIEMNHNVIIKNDSESENSFINFVNLKKNKTTVEHESKHEDFTISENIKKKFHPIKSFKEEPNFEI